MKRFDEDDIILSCLSVSCFCLTSFYILLTEKISMHDYYLGFSNFAFPTKPLRKDELTHKTFNE